MSREQSRIFMLESENRALKAENRELRRVAEDARELMQALDKECNDLIPDPAIYPLELKLRQAIAALDSKRMDELEQLENGPWSQFVKECKEVAVRAEGAREERERIQTAIKNMLEQLADLEHEQWMTWSKAVAHEVSDERRQRWLSYWVPYSQLTDEIKEHDRVWAREVISKVLELIKEANND